MGWCGVVGDEGLGGVRVRLRLGLPSSDGVPRVSDGGSPAAWSRLMGWPPCLPDCEGVELAG